MRTVKMKIKTIWRSPNPKKKRKLEWLKKHIPYKKNIKSEMGATELSGMPYEVHKMSFREA